MEGNIIENIYVGKVWN